jgi:hypothetical protein
MTEIPKLVSLAYCFWLKFVSSSSRTKNSTIDSLISCFDRRSRNRWVSAPLSPIFSLFLSPSGKLYLKVQNLLAEDAKVQISSSPVIEKQRRPGPKQPAYGIPASQWPTVVHRVVEQKEPLRSVAAAYGVSHETIRRIMLHVHQQRGQQEA